MIEFDLSRFRELAFGRGAMSDHPLHDESAVEKLIEDLPGDALAGLAELTHWVLSINSDDSFTPGRRGRVLMALDAAVRPFWSGLTTQYLEPHGRPAEGHDGEASLLRAMIESAAAFATGFGFCTEIAAKPSR